MRCKMLVTRYTDMSELNEEPNFLSRHHSLADVHSHCRSITQFTPLFRQLYTMQFFAPQNKSKSKSRAEYVAYMGIVTTASVLQ